MGEKEKYLVLFGLEPDYGTGDLKEAYRVLSKVWHPDRFTQNETLRVKAEEKSKEINQGYEFLKENLEKKQKSASAQTGKASNAYTYEKEKAGSSTTGRRRSPHHKRSRAAYNKTPMFRPRSFFSWWVLIPFMFLIFALPILPILLQEEQQEKQERGQEYLPFILGMERNAEERNEGYASLNVGMEKFENAEYHQALQYIDKALAQNPDLAKAYLLRGAVNSRLNDATYAIRDYTYAIDLDPDETFAYYGRGLVYKNSGRYADAIADFDKAITRDSDLAELYVVRGRVKYEAQDYQGAIRDFSRAIELDSGYASAYASRGLVRYTARDYRRAAQDFNRAIEVGSEGGYELGISFDNSFGDLFYDRGLEE